MSWITLTEADILTGITGAELSAARSAALKVAQVDPMPETIAQVTREIRGRVAACARNTLGAEGTIPDECQATAIDIAVYRLCKRVPGGALLTKQREDANSAALSFLRDVAACSVAIISPTSPAAAQAGGPAVQLVSTTPRRADRTRLAGL